MGVQSSSRSSLLQQEKNLRSIEVGSGGSEREKRRRTAERKTAMAGIFASPKAVNTTDRRKKKKKTVTPTNVRSVKHGTLFPVIGTLFSSSHIKNVCVLFEVSEILELFRTVGKLGDL
jgi:hypothetical protein